MPQQLWRAGIPGDGFTGGYGIPPGQTCPKLSKISLTRRVGDLDAQVGEAAAQSKSPDELIGPVPVRHWTRQARAADDQRMVADDRSVEPPAPGIIRPTQVGEQLAGDGGTGDASNSVRPAGPIQFRTCRNSSGAATPRTPGSTGARCCRWTSRRH